MGDALAHLANSTKLEWTCNLNTEYTPKKNYRRTSIICTIGETHASGPLLLKGGRTDPLRYRS
jgi:hypothetical protein